MISAPQTLSAEDELIDFDCSEESLSIWLQRNALKNHKNGASKVFVIKMDGKVIGYYCLSAGSIVHIEAPKALTRNAPNPLPIILLGRLAIDKNHKAKGLGGLLLKDAINRSLSLAQNLGVVALVAHALNNSAKEFYLQYGFIQSPLAPMTLILPLKNF